MPLGRFWFQVLVPGFVINGRTAFSACTLWLDYFRKNNQAANVPGGARIGRIGNQSAPPGSGQIMLNRQRAIKTGYYLLVFWGYWIVGCGEDREPPCMPEHFD